MKLSPMASRLYNELWGLADHSGRIDRTPRQLETKIFFGEGVVIEPLIEELMRAGLVVESMGYISIVNFLRRGSET